jgi:hypothetical protein
MLRTLTTTMFTSLATGTAGTAMAQTPGNSAPASYCDEGYWQAYLDGDERRRAAERPTRLEPALTIRSCCSGVSSSFPPKATAARRR